MYSVINTYQQAIISAIPRRDVAEYDWLVQNVAQANTQSYQRRYSRFWLMGRVPGNFVLPYFAALSVAIQQPPPLGNLCQTLSQYSTRSNGVQTLQFSFATKLLHMVQPQLPIYDSRVCRFYLFEQNPPTKQSLQQRTNRLLGFYSFLSAEYARVINGNLLSNAIAAFRQHFQPQQHSDVKIVDWLIWALVGLADDGALLKRQIVYV